MRSRWVILAVVGTTLAAPSLGHSGKAANGAGDPTYFRIDVTVEGQFTVDYGPDPGPNTSDYSGQATSSWSSELASVTRWNGGSEIEGAYTHTKGRISLSESTSVVSHFPGSPDSAFTCANGQSSMRGGTHPGLPDSDLPPGTSARFVRDIGRVAIRPAGGGKQAVEYRVDVGPQFDADCFDGGHEPLNHYLISPAHSSVLEADTSTLSECCVIPRGAFNPLFDRSYEQTFSRSIQFDEAGNPSGPYPHAGADYPHKFDGTSSVTFEIKRITAKKFKRLDDRYDDLDNQGD